MNWISTLHLGLSLSCLVAIVWLFLHYSKNFSSENRPKKDILYISGYGVFIILELIVYVCLGNYRSDNIIDTISFGATLSSLIMSVVAIIFTIVSGRDAKEQLGRITEATKKLAETAESLIEFKAVATVLSDQLTDMDEKIQELQNETTEFHETFLDHFAQENKTNERDNRNSPNTDVTQFIDSGSIYGAMAMLICGLSYKTRIKFDIELFKPEYTNDYFYGYIIASAAAGIINISGNWPDINVSSVASDLDEKCKKYLIRAIKSQTDKSDKNRLRELINSILGYYNQSLLTDDDIKTGASD